MYGYDPDFVAVVNEIPAETQQQIVEGAREGLSTFLDELDAAFPLSAYQRDLVTTACLALLRSAAVNIQGDPSYALRMVNDIPLFRVSSFLTFKAFVEKYGNPLDAPANADQLALPLEDSVE